MEPFGVFRFDAIAAAMDRVDLVRKQTFSFADAKHTWSTIYRYSQISAEPWLFNVCFQYSCSGLPRCNVSIAAPNRMISLVIARSVAAVRSRLYIVMSCRHSSMPSHLVPGHGEVCALKINFSIRISAFGRPGEGECIWL